jgi:hypothetical protein
MLHCRLLVAAGLALAATLVAIAPAGASPGGRTATFLVPVTPEDDEQSSQPARTSPIRLTVMDQTGAVIVGAIVTVVPEKGGQTLQTVTDDKGQARLDVPQGEYRIAVESVGFDVFRLEQQRVRGGGIRRDVTLTIAGMMEEIEVGQDPQESNTDPRGSAFSTVLTREQIDQLPDDPDQLEEALREMAGPGASIRVNGFRRGGLPPKDQIREIRFRQNAYAADTHESSNFSVDITTQPGSRGWRSSVTVGFRDESLDARNAFAPSKADEETRRGQFSLDGPIWKNRTSLELNVDGYDAFEARPIVATTPEGPISGSVQQPSQRANVRLGVDHALSKTQTLRAEFETRGVDAGAQGLRDLDLPERAYSRTNRERRYGVQVKGTIGKRAFNELRAEVRWIDTDTVPDSLAPAVKVNGAFNAGGAQTQGGRESREIELAQNLDYSRGKHTVRAGYLFESGSYTSDDIRNAGGTFTFANLDAYEASAPSTYTRRVGNPLVSYAQNQAAWFVQDDFRVRKDLTLSFGVRHEWQDHVDSFWNIAPRGGFAWSPFRNGKTTFRGGAGIFFNWMDASVYEETLQVDGTRLQDIVIRNPGYPTIIDGGIEEFLPRGRVQLAEEITMPRITQVSLGIERTLGPQMRLNATYFYRDGDSLLRGRDVNAPGPDGVRPEPRVGTVTESQSTGSSRAHQLVVGFNVPGPNQRFFVGGNYTLSFVRDDGDGPFSLPADNLQPDEWGPSRSDVRHRVGSFLSVRLPWSLRASGSIRVESAPPYNVTTGRDDNGDTIFTDRPTGVGRNSARADEYVDLNLRLGYAFGFGKRSDRGPGGGGGGGGGPVVVRIGERGGAGGGMPFMSDRTKLVSCEVYASATNLLNRTNFAGYSGVITSPYYGQPTSARPPRRIEVGMRVGF